MNNTESEKERIREFIEFVEAEPTTPSARVDAAVLARVKKDLKPAPLKVLAKLGVVQAAAGLVTLTICPQFGVGFGVHNELLHRLHLATSPGIFYLLCGILFVVLGATFGGMLLTRPEMGAMGSGKYLFFIIYSVLAYLVLVGLGPDAFVWNSLTWILGAILGNLFGFEIIMWVRKANLSM